MKTPIVNFCKEYKEKNAIRMHMPGHKGKEFLGIEPLDITEIDGADNLFHANGIIEESEKNASLLFGIPTFYSTEGSSLAIRAMLYLALSQKNGGYILAARNVHKTFITASALLGFDVKWIYSKVSLSYQECILTKEDIDEALKDLEIKPVALYLTSPDYLGNVLDIKGIAEVCHKYGVMLLLDNAHGAYLSFIEKNPITLGADMASSSAHKTLPVITGGAYLQINPRNSYCLEHARDALALFASTSPSYLILESLDLANDYLDKNRDLYPKFMDKILRIKQELSNHGYIIKGNEEMKITIDTKEYGYKGADFADILKANSIIPEFYDEDYLVLMPTPFNEDSEISILLKVLLSIPKKEHLLKREFQITKREKVLSIRDAVLQKRKKVWVKDALGKVLADTIVTCPPAVPILVSGERIDLDAISMFQYYGIDKVSIIEEK